MNYENILLEISDRIATITINRPSQLNALNKKTISELSICFQSLEENADVRVVLITGSGDKAFVAGADIKEFADFDVEHGMRLAHEGQMILFNKIERMGTPVIAVVNGFALGGGLELAMAAHIRVASEGARLGLPEVSLGVIPGYGGTQRLAQLVGKGKAMEMVTTAGMIDAADAYQWGLVNHVAPHEEIMTLAQKIAGKILKNSPNAISAAIRAINGGYDFETDGYAKEIEEFGNCFGTPEFIEGTSAFVEKRKPVY